MRVLVLATGTIEPEDVRDALGDDASDAEIRLVTPALDGTWLARVMDDHEEAREEAEEIETESTDALRDAELSVSGEVGDADPLQAIEDAMATFSADQIVLFVHPDEDDHGVHEDLDPEDVEERFGVPVVRLDQAG
jgi:hypothetical protein